MSTFDLPPLMLMRLHSPHTSEQIVINMCRVDAICERRGVGGATIGATVCVGDREFEVRETPQQICMQVADYIKVAAAANLMMEVAR